MHSCYLDRLDWGCFRREFVVPCSTVKDFSAVTIFLLKYSGKKINTFQFHLSLVKSSKLLLELSLVWLFVVVFSFSSSTLVFLLIYLVNTALVSKTALGQLNNNNYCNIVIASQP